MSDLIVCENNNGELEEVGRSIYRSNDNYRNLANVMEHPEFKCFFDDNFKDWTSARTTLMIMKLYQSIEKDSSKKLSGYEKIAIVDSVINDSKMRQNVVKAINEWAGDNKDDGVYLLKK